LSAKAAAGRIVVIEAPSLGDAPKTRAVAELLDRLPVEGQTLIVTAGVDTALLRATGNLAGVKVAPAQRLTVHDLLTAEFILLTRPAVDAVTEVLGND
ncbi:MAG: 50S ribosomal protein L4, partial [Armatimonadetes bacterium]|nr:50S ribosomal protein L4 [Armatimonadota bacterium]